MIDAIETISATNATIIASDPSPKRDAGNLLSSSKVARLRSLYVELPKLQFTNLTVELRDEKLKD